MAYPDLKPLPENSLGSDRSCIVRNGMGPTIKCDAVDCGRKVVAIYGNTGYILFECP